MAATAKQKLTPEEYLAIERMAEVKSEFHDGEMYAMSGGSDAHSRLAVRLVSQLDQHASSKGSLIYNSDMKVWIADYRRFLYPDISGLCGQSQFRDSARDVLLNPTFVIEVLSPSTEAYDRGRKMRYFFTIPSLMEYVLIAQDEVRAEKFTRQSDGSLKIEAFAGSDAVLPLNALGIELPLGSFYAGVELSPPAPEPPERPR